MYVDNKVATVQQYLRKLSGLEKEPGGICDHNYTKPWSAHPDSQRTKPAKLLFMNAVLRPKSVHTYSDEEIDVVNISSETDSSPSPFDNQKTKVLANELERSLMCNSKIDNDGSELANFPIENCTAHQRNIYRDVLQLINDDILAKMTYSGQSHEFIKRKNVTESCARKLRLIFANTFYDFDDLILWIHKLVLDKGDLLSISSYLNILQALREKIPRIVDEILRSYSGQFGFEYLCQIMKKQWDPSVPVLNQNKLKKLPGNPFLIMSCAGFELTKATESPRFRFWTNNLNALCKTMHIPMNYDGNCTFEEVLKDSVLALRNKITEFKNHFPNRAVILSGWTIGALIACHVALDAAVDAVLCFGFPLTGVNGSRGDLNDPLLESKVPILFIIGQNSNMCSTDDIEDFRSRMRVETGLVIVGGADDLLRVSRQKLLQESITQEIVDRCILEEISDFLQTSLVKLPTTSNSLSYTPIKSCPTIIEEGSEQDIVNEEENGKRKRRRPKEYSPELTSSRKRAKHSTRKEIPNVSIKSRLFPSSSETSNSGSSKNVKQTMTKAAKKNPEKRGVGRPPNVIGRKKPLIKPDPKISKQEKLKAVKPVPKISKQENFKTVKPVPKISKEENFKTVKPVPKISKQEDFKTVKPVPKISKLENFKTVKPVPEISKQENFKTVKPVSSASVVASKSTIPFALNILPKKNDPVDVEKAFGKDSSFLPRPLTPTEPEDTISAEETERIMAEICATYAITSGSSKNHGFATPISQIITNSEKSFMPPSDQSSVAILGSKGMPGSIIKPVLNSSTDSKKEVSVSVSPCGFKTVFHQAPVTRLKNITGVNLALNSQNNLNTSKAVIKVPSNTVLVSGQTLKTPSGKVLQLLSKGPILLKDKNTLTGSSNNSESSEQQSCNLSLLSDIAGMTKSLDSPKKLDASSSSATLVKLAVPDKSQNLKQYHVLKTLQTRSPPVRIETPEEMVEKQLAIQALNKSIGMETSTPLSVKDSGYSICFAKPDGSIISRAVPRPGSATYIRQSIISQPSGRGKIRPLLPSKTYQFYHK